MRILILLNSIRVSGTERLMIALSQKFEMTGDQVYLFPLITPFDTRFKNSLERNEKKLNFIFPKYIERFDWFFWKLNGLTTSLFNWSIRSFLLAKFVERVCKKKNIEIIVSNSYPTDVFVLPIVTKTSIPLVVVDHGSYSYYDLDKTPFSRRTLDSCNAVVGVSNWVVQRLQLLNLNKSINLIHNGHVSIESGLDFPFRDQLVSKSHFVFCMHGRGSDQKGWDIAIKAYQLVKSKGYKIKLILLSEGVIIDNLKKENGNDPDLIFGGFIYNLGDVFEYVNAGLVLSKKYEAFGLVVLDYFSKGIPVVASNLDGLSQVMKFENVTGGLLVDLDDSGAPIVDEVVKAMESLLIDENLYHSLSQGGKAITNHFSLDKCAFNYREIFQSLV